MSTSQERGSGTLGNMFQSEAVSAQTTLTHSLPPGTPLLRRGERPMQVLHVLKGRVVLGVMHNGQIEHQLGQVDGPFWLEASSALLGLPHVVDALADSAVQVQSVPVGDFLQALDGLPDATGDLLRDMARAQRQQTEVAVSRVAKDADARCAEWLLRHAEPVQGSVCLAVTLRERKRTIAAQLGIAPETFSRVLKHLRERQLISGAGRVLDLPDPQGLRELAGI